MNSSSWHYTIFYFKGITHFTLYYLDANTSPLYNETKVGEGTILVYDGIGVVIHKEAVIGKTVLLSQT